MLFDFSHSVPRTAAKALRVFYAFSNTKQDGPTSDTLFTLSDKWQPLCRTYGSHL